MEDTDYFLQRIRGNLPYVLQGDLRLGNADEQRLALLSHQEYTVIDHERFLGKSETAIELLSKIRQYRAFHAAYASNRTYHELARLYYALMSGASTLGHPYDAAYYKKAITTMGTKDAPSVLLLGFSTIYSLENLAALLHLNGVRNPRITAFDCSEEPLDEAQKYCGSELYGAAITYKKGDALDPANFNRDMFDLIATHLFFTHISHKDKKSLTGNIHQWLKHGAAFADEEIIVPGDIDRSRYARYYRTLAQEYSPSDHSMARRQIADMMEQFGRHSRFFPYSSLDGLVHDFRAAGFQVDSQFLMHRSMLDSGEQVMSCPVYHVRATK